MKTSADSGRKRETFIGEHITGPFVDVVESVAGSILAFPLRVVDKVIDKSIAGVRNAISSLIGFPVSKK